MTNTNLAFEEIMKSRIEVLTDSLSLSNSPWNAWELEFIESLEGKEFKNLSEKQRKVVENLWDKL